MSAGSVPNNRQPTYAAVELVRMATTPRPSVSIWRCAKDEEVKVASVRAISAKVFLFIMAVIDLSLETTGFDR